MLKEMDTSTNVILEDPDNYSKARGILERLMITLGKTKRELMELENASPILQECYHSEIQNKVSQPLTDAILFLGEMSGFLVSDDIIENRLSSLTYESK